MLPAPIKNWVLRSVWLTRDVFHRRSAQPIKDFWLHFTELQLLPASPHLNPGRDGVSIAIFLPGLHEEASSFSPRTGMNQGSCIHLPLECQNAASNMRIKISSLHKIRSTILITIYAERS